MTPPARARPAPLNPAAWWPTAPRLRTASAKPASAARAGAVWPQVQRAGKMAQRHGSQKPKNLRELRDKRVDVSHHRNPPAKSAGATSIGSRRDMEEPIAAGQWKSTVKLWPKLGCKITPDDKGARTRAKRCTSNGGPPAAHHHLPSKKAGLVTCDDPEGRETVF